MQPKKKESDDKVKQWKTLQDKGTVGGAEGGLGGERKYDCITVGLKKDKIGQFRQITE